MTRHKRRESLSNRQKEAFKSGAEQFRCQLQPMMRDLKAFGPSYRALLAIGQAIDASYDVLEVEKPDRLGMGPRSEPITSS